MRIKETTVEETTETKAAGEDERKIKTIIVRIEGFEGDKEDYMELYNNIFKD